MIKVIDKTTKRHIFDVDNGKFRIGQHIGFNFVSNDSLYASFKVIEVRSSAVIVMFDGFLTQEQVEAAR